MKGETVRFLKSEIVSHIKLYNKDTFSCQN